MGYFCVLQVWQDGGGASLPEMEQPPSTLCGHPHFPAGTGNFSTLSNAKVINFIFCTIYIGLSDKWQDMIWVSIKLGWSVNYLQKN